MTSIEKIEHISQDKIKDKFGHVCGGTSSIELIVINNAREYENTKIELENMIEEIFCKYENMYDFYTKDNLNFILRFIAKYAASFTWQQQNYFIRNGGFLFDEKALMLMQWEGDYGSCGGYIFCNKEEDGINFIKKRYTGTLGGDEFTFVIFSSQNNNIDSYNCILTKDHHEYLHEYTQSDIIKQFNLSDDFFAEKICDISDDLDIKKSTSIFDISMKKIYFN
jgi:hypothetical protein